jgi:hypothetical protein
LKDYKTGTSAGGNVLSALTSSLSGSLGFKSIAGVSATDRGHGAMKIEIKFRSQTLAIVGFSGSVEIPLKNKKSRMQHMHALLATGISKINQA